MASFALRQFFTNKLRDMARIYLDNAATSFPKPEAVYAAVDHYQRHLGAAAGRGAYGTSGEVGGIIERLRQNLARLFQGESSQQFAFTFNGTDALNLAIHGVLRPGDHVITTAAEHNSVLRPLRSLGDQGVAVTVVDVDEHGRVSVDAVREAFRPTTRLMVVTHASNVTGVIQPIERLVEVARERGVLSLLDAAQTAGHVPIDLTAWPVDLLACPGHKGLLGPLGTGVLYVRPGVEGLLRTVRQGGTGTASESETHPRVMPAMLEAGNLNVAGLVGLEASTRWLMERGVARLEGKAQQLTRYLLEGLRGIEGIRVYGDDGGPRVGVVSFTLADWPPSDLANVLDTEFGIETRAGLHCAPRIHERLGTLSQGGTLRASVGPLTSEVEIDAILDALRQISG